jgi:4-diphosphocytidyl-2C-methyl-D-erythritol kinase
VLPPVEIPTPAVYRRFDEMRLGRGDVIADEPDWAAWAAWAKLPARELMQRLVNDLEPAAFALEPALGELRAALERKLSRVVRMSGSGSSLFTLCDDADEAAAIARAVTGDDRKEAPMTGVGARVVRVAPEIVRAVAGETGAGATAEATTEPSVRA